MMCSFSASRKKPVSSYQQLHQRCGNAWVRPSFTQHSLFNVHFDCNLAEVIIYT